MGGTRSLLGVVSSLVLAISIFSPQLSFGDDLVAGGAVVDTPARRTLPGAGELKLVPGVNTENLQFPRLKILRDVGKQAKDGFDPKTNTTDVNKSLCGQNDGRMPEAYILCREVAVFVHDLAAKVDTDVKGEVLLAKRALAAEAVVKAAGDSPNQEALIKAQAASYEKAAAIMDKIHKRIAAATTEVKEAIKKFQDTIKAKPELMKFQRLKFVYDPNDQPGEPKTVLFIARLLLEVEERDALNNKSGFELAASNLRKGVGRLVSLDGGDGVDLTPAAPSRDGLNQPNRDAPNAGDPPNIAANGDGDEKGPPKGPEATEDWQKLLVAGTAVAGAFVVGMQFGKDKDEPAAETQAEETDEGADTSAVNESLLAKILAGIDGSEEDYVNQQLLEAEMAAEARAPNVDSLNELKDEYETAFDAAIADAGGDQAKVSKLQAARAEVLSRIANFVAEAELEFDSGIPVTVVNPEPQ